MKITRDYYPIVANLSSSVFGISGYYLLLLYLSYSTFRSALITGIADSLSSIFLFISPVIGAWIDRKQLLGRISAYSSALRTLSLFPIVFSLITKNNFILLISLFISSAIVGLTSDIINSVRSVWFQEVLDKKSYRKATSFNQIIGTVSEVVGYISVGFSFVYGFYAPTLIVLVTLAVSALAYPKVKRDKIETPEKEGNMISSTIGGIRYVWKSLDFRRLLVAYFLFNFVAGSLGIFFTVLTVNNASHNAILLSTLLTVLSLGILLGSSLASFIKISVKRLVYVTTFVVGTILIFTGFESSYSIDLSASLIIGLLLGNFMVGAMAYIRERSDRRYIARTIGTTTSFSQSATFLSGIVSGYLVSEFSVNIAICIIGFVLIAASLYFYLQ